MGDNPSNRSIIAYMKKYKMFLQIGFPFAITEDPTGNANPTNGEDDKDASKDFEPKDGDSDSEKALKEQNKRLFERAKKAEGFEKQADGSWLKKPKSPTPPAPDLSKPTPKDDNVDDRVSKLELSEKKRNFGYDNGLSPEETDHLFRFAGDKTPDEALKDPFFQAGLKEMRRSKRVAEAIPSSSNRATKVDGKGFDEMSSEERSKNWDKIVGSKKK